MLQPFSYYLETNKEHGTVSQIHGSYILADGLPSARLKELVLFETGDIGWVAGLQRDFVEIYFLETKRITPGTKVVLTQQQFSIPVGDYLLGKTISSASFFLDSAKIRPVHAPPKRIEHRMKITKPFKTGTTVVDFMVPLGYGQKELIIGDRKTGKSSFVLTTIKHQASKGVIPIYALIGKRQSEIKALEEIMEEEKLREKAIIVASRSNDSLSEIYLNPFSAMTIAEYFAETGRNVLVIFDDLYTHARFYRELSLTSNNFPGRDSYPGNIFHTHAKLLERAGNFKSSASHAEDSVSITCLPIVETVEGDITGYIQTNLMGITDGHILFDSEVFSKGQRPAVNIHLSVTRAGRQTQSQVIADINRELTAFFALYEQMLNVSHFGTELTLDGTFILNKGDMIFNFFNQSQMVVISEEVELIVFALIWINVIKEKKQIFPARKKLQEAQKQEETRKIFQSCIDAMSFNDMLKKITEVKDFFVPLCQ